LKRSLNVTYGDIPTNQTLINAQYWDNKTTVFLIMYQNVLTIENNLHPSLACGARAEALGVLFWQMVIF
jgi:hypothetical protein